MPLLSSSSFLLLTLFSSALAAVLTTRDAEGELPNTYIVKFRNGLTDGIRSNHTAWIRNSQRVDADGTILQGIRHEFSLAFDGYSAVLDDVLFEKVKASEAVAEVRPVGLSVPPRVFLTEERVYNSTPATIRWTDDGRGPAEVQTENNRGWNANRLSHRTFRQTSYADGPWIHDGYLGQGVTVYVLDTGINLENPGFMGSTVVHGKNLVKGTQPSDKHGHGTMCAGVIAGDAHGLAPKAKTVNVKIANDQDRSACDDSVAGIEWVVNQPGDNNMKVISMSQTGFTGRPDVSTAVAAAVKKGVHVVVCAGNNDVDACNVEPSNAPGAIVVGSIEPNGRFPTKKTSPEGTNVGKCVTVFAPGSRVPTLSAKNISPSYKYFSWGTSIAAPQVAALIANHLSRVGPMNPEAVMKWLQDTATKGQVSGTDGNLRDSPNLIAFSGVGETMDQVNASVVAKQPEAVESGESESSSSDSSSKA